ncbi:MAG TPA: hypothetical protein VFL27_13930 [Candidatus Dormibacteraeota bacterium]|nr:hypothetical protein [Candidatus Dormibacteraeota bacterium]
MTLKIRIIASHGERGRWPVPKIVYRAEAYDDRDRFADSKWTCEHEHETAEHAFHCGQEWMAQNSKID